MRIVLKTILLSDEVCVQDETKLLRFERSHLSEKTSPVLGITMNEAKSLLMATQQAMVVA